MNLFPGASGPDRAPAGLLRRPPAEPPWGSNMKDSTGEGAMIPRTTVDMASMGGRRPGFLGGREARLRGPAGKGKCLASPLHEDPGGPTVPLLLRVWS